MTKIFQQRMLEFFYVLGAAVSAFLFLAQLPQAILDAMNYLLAVQQSFWKIFSPVKHVIDYFIIEVFSIKAPEMFIEYIIIGIIYNSLFIRMTGIFVYNLSIFDSETTSHNSKQKIVAIRILLSLFFIIFFTLIFIPLWPLIAAGTIVNKAARGEYYPINNVYKLLIRDYLKNKIQPHTQPLYYEMHYGINKALRLQMLSVTLAVVILFAATSVEMIYRAIIVP